MSLSHLKFQARLKPTSSLPTLHFSETPLLESHFLINQLNLSIPQIKY